MSNHEMWQKSAVTYRSWAYKPVYEDVGCMTSCQF